jgi:hypothetical protein
MGRAGIGLLERLLPWLERVAPGALGVVLKFALAIGGGLLVGAVVVLVIVVVVFNFPGQFVKHDMFPGVVNTGVVVGPTIGGFATLGALGAFGGLMTGITSAVTLHPRLVEIRGNARKKDLSAGSTPEPPTSLSTADNPEH